MTRAIRLLYATHDGQTKKIADRLAAIWQKNEQAHTLYPLTETAVDPLFWPEKEIIVLMAPIRYGRHLPPVERFLKTHKKELRKRPLVLISINLTARKSGKNTPETNPYFRKWVKRHNLAPTLGAVLAGRLDYKLYSLWEKWIIRFIMVLTGGPTNFDAVIDYTPWEQIDALAEQIACLGEERKAA